MDHEVSASKVVTTPDGFVNRYTSTPVTRHSIGSINRSLLTPCRRIGLGRPSTGSLKKSGQIGIFRSPGNENSPVMPKNEQTPPMSSNRRLIISPLGTRNCEDTLSHNEKQLKTTPVTSKVDGCIPINCDIIKNKPRKTSGVKRCLSDTSKSKENKNNVQEVKTDNKNSEENETADSDLMDTEAVITVKSKAESESEQTCLQINSDKKQKLEITNKTIAEIAERIQKKKRQLENIRIQEAYAKKNDLNTLRELTRKWRKGGQDALHRMLKMADDMGFKVTLLELIQQYNFPLELIRYNADLEDFEFEGF